MILTREQEERMSVLMDGTKVIGSEDDCPIIVYPNGRLMKVSRQGRLVSVRKDTEDQIAKRMLKRWERDPAS